jgi:hypothetical protein
MWGVCGEHGVLLGVCLIGRFNNDDDDRPDIITKNKKETTCTLIDVAIPADGNVV